MWLAATVEGVYVDFIPFEERGIEGDGLFYSAALDGCSSVTDECKWGVSENWYGCAFEAIVCAAVSAYFSDCGGTFSEAGVIWGGEECVCCAEFFGDGEFGFVYVDSDDCIGAADGGCLDGV